MSRHPKPKSAGTIRSLPEGVDEGELFGGRRGPDLRYEPPRPMRKHIGRFLRESREAMGLTQAQMAQRCGLSVNHYGRIEGGTVDFGLCTLEALADIVGMGMADLCDPAVIANEDPFDLDARTLRRVQETLHLLRDRVERYVERAIGTVPRDGHGRRASRKR